MTLCPACKPEKDLFTLGWLQRLCAAHQRQAYDTIDRVVRGVDRELTRMDVGTDVPGGGAA